MKKTIKVVFQAVVSLCMAFLGALLCVKFEIGYWAAPIWAFAGGGIIGCVITGVFDVTARKTRYESINKNGLKEAA